MMRRLVLILATLMLVACQEKDLSDLEAFVDEVKSRSPGGVKPAPEPVAVDTFIYVAGDRRDPFVKEVDQHAEVEQVVDNGIRPDASRRKEELELFDLDSLRMVGTLEKDGSTWGLVQTDDGTIHRVTDGNYMGRNHGRIVEISENKIKMVELMQIGAGYQEQEAALGLGEGGQ